MIRHKSINLISWIGIALTIVLTVLVTKAASARWIESKDTIGYENHIFDTAEVHKIDIVMDDWDGFIQTATSEEYSSATIIIDGEKYSNVGIRAKGNSSLSSVASYGTDRYSFKLEFDHYRSDGSYYGLDKLNLNNLMYDSSYMKDYLTYTMMNEIGIASPLSSYVYLTVNGSDWGLYLAVEGVEESFLERNYGKDHGNLYKPDSMDMGGGRGAGANFRMDDFMNEGDSPGGFNSGEIPEGLNFENMPEDFNSGELPEGFNFENMPENFNSGELPEGFNFENMPEDFNSEDFPEGFNIGEMPEGFSSPMNGDMNNGDGGGRGFTSSGNSDVALQYIDDNPDSYPDIFDNAKSDITEADKERLIASLKQLSQSENLEEVVNIEDVIKYFVVHDFVQNGDSYTGAMMHNYYLYEDDGMLSMIPWDYNLAFGSFNGMGTNQSEKSSSTSVVNSPIDSPVSSGTVESRPMLAWIFENEEYLDQYHQEYADFISAFFDSQDFEQLIDETVALIAPYVQKDPTAFFSYEEFQAGVETLREFCLLRAESIKGQLQGSIPSTDEGQDADSSKLVDASHLSLSNMGSMNTGGNPSFNNAPTDAANPNQNGNAFPGRNRPDENPTNQTMDGFPSVDESTSDTSDNQTMDGFAPLDESESNNQTTEGFSPLDEGTSTDQQRQRPSNNGRGDNNGAASPEGINPPSGFTEPSNQESSSNEKLVLLGGSVLVLAIGIIIAKIYR